MKRITFASCAMLVTCLPTPVLLQAQSNVATSSSSLAISGENAINVAEDRSGCLLLCGGSVLPKSILDTFYQRGGGCDGNLVIIPTASPRSDLGDFTIWQAIWKGYDWKEVSIVHASNREKAMEDSLCENLRTATAVWIAGGDQQRLCDRYLGTPLFTELQNVLKRGGVIGGTSAGAAIASNKMISGGITIPKVSKGWSLMPSTIVDQHFSQRGRFERLARAVEQHPDQVGIGIDEATGILIDRDGLQVIGNGSIYVYRSRKNTLDSSQTLDGSNTNLIGSQFKGLVTNRHTSGSTLRSDDWNRLITWVQGVRSKE